MKGDVLAHLIPAEQAGDRSLSRADLACNNHKTSSFINRIDKAIERLGVYITGKEEFGIRRYVEWFFCEIVKLFVHLLPHYTNFLFSRSRVNA